MMFNIMEWRTQCHRSPTFIPPNKHLAYCNNHALEQDPIGLPTALRNQTQIPYKKVFLLLTRDLTWEQTKKLFSLHLGITETLKNPGPTITTPTSQSLMPSPLLWSSFLLWFIATPAMLLMMLPGSTTTHHIISLFIAAVVSVLAYCG